MALEYKTDKATRVLMLYHRLLQGEHIDKAGFSVEHGINERTFDRDIEDIRLFLSDIYSVEEVVYDAETKSYSMTKEKMKPLDRMEATVILKILLSSESLREDEMNGLINSILSVVNKTDKQVLSDYLSYEQERYLSQEKEAIIKVIVDLYAVIRRGMDIEIQLSDCNQKVFRKQVAPLKIVLEDKIFCLVCVELMNSQVLMKYPVNVIKEFKVLNTAYSRVHKEKYNEDKEKQKWQ